MHNRLIRGSGSRGPAALGAALAAQNAPGWDLVIRGGRVLDGAGNPWVLADVAVRGDTIAAIGPGSPARARGRSTPAASSCRPVIDTHTHARRGIFEVPTADNYVRQGVTTIFEGPDGGAPVPLAPFLAKIAASASPQLGMFVGQGSVREAVIGRADREGHRRRTRDDEGMVRQGMLDGAFG